MAFYSYNMVTRDMTKYNTQVPAGRKYVYFVISRVIVL